MESSTSGAKKVGPDEGARLVVLGSQQRVVLAGEDMGGAFTVLETISSPGRGSPTHVHRNEDESFYLLTGRVEFRFGGEVVHAEGCTAVHIPRGVPHAFTVAGDGPATMRVTLVPAGLECLFTELALFPPGPPDRARLAEVAARYGVEFLDEPAGPAA